MSAASWAPAEIEMLRTLAAEKLSAADIGDRLGKTRNMVIGKARRAGIVLLHKQHEPLKPWNDRRRAAERERIARKRRIAPPSQRVIRDTKLRAQSKPKAKVAPFTVTLEQLQFGMCKYPEGDRVPFVFCGAAAEDGGSYCNFHASLCYREPPPRTGRRTWL